MASTPGLARPEQRKNRMVFDGMSERSDTYRRRARECDDAAERVADPEARAAYLAMGTRWRKMADELEAIEDYVNKGGQPPK